MTVSQQDASSTEVKIVPAHKQKDAEKRRQRVIALATGSEKVMAQHRASRASFERGEPPIPGEQVLREARERREGT